MADEQQQGIRTSNPEAAQALYTRMANCAVGQDTSVVLAAALMVVWTAASQAKENHADNVQNIETALQLVRDGVLPSGRRAAQN